MIDSLDPTKVDLSLAEKYRNGLEKAVEEYGIEDIAFVNSRQEVIDGAIRLLQGYGIEELFLSDSERALFALAIADSWLSTNILDEKKALLDILKIVAIGPDLEGTNVSYSNNVRVLSLRKHKRGTSFDPSRPENNEKSAIDFSTLNRLLPFVDDDFTSKVVSSLVWNSKERVKVPFIRKVFRLREEFGIKRETEKPFEVRVLKISSETCRVLFGFTGITFTSQNGERVIVFICNDYQKLGILEHEYLHSQFGGFSSKFYQNLLFSALDEVIVEDAVSPNRYWAYGNLRKVWKDNIFLTEEMLRSRQNGFKGGENSRREFLAGVVNQVGLQGFLALSRMSPIDDFESFGNVAESILLHPDEVYSILNRIRKNRTESSYLQIRHKMNCRLPRNHILNFLRKSSPIPVP